MSGYDKKNPREEAAHRRHRSPLGRCRNDVKRQDGSPEERLTSLPNDILFSILSFLTIKQCVALFTVCSRFRRHLPSLIPRRDTFRFDVGRPYGGDDIPQQSAFPSGVLLRQCRIVFHDVATSFPQILKQLLHEDLASAGVQDLILDASGNRWFVIGASQLGFFCIKSVRSLSLLRIPTTDYFDRRPPSSFPCTTLTSLKIKLCVLRFDFLLSLLASCPFLETLQLVRCYGLDRGIDKLSIHSASIKHLVLFFWCPCVLAIDVHSPKLEYLVVNVVTALRIEAPKIQNASLLLDLEPLASC